MGAEVGPVTIVDTLDQTAVRPGERAKTLAALEVLLRIVRKGVDCFPDDDLETIIVYLSVAAASTSRHLRDPAVLALMAEEPIPDHLHRAISGRAVAQATGLPRETVRRRIEALVAAGRLTREADGVRTGAGELTKGQNLEFIRFLIHEMDTASARVGRFDVP
jgi:hypothetical protein